MWQNIKLEESLNIASQSYGGLVELKYTNAAHGLPSLAGLAPDSPAQV
jgi:hypothetical protein